MSEGGKTTHVLVLGAWRGAWCWKRVRDELAGRGHRVFLGQPLQHFVDGLGLEIEMDCRETS